MTGRKFDGGKLRYDLMPTLAFENVVKVLTYGTIKYDDENWKLVPNGRKRYLAAAMRHIQEYRKGEMFDDETKTHHLSNAVTDLLFIIEKDLQGWEDVDEKGSDMNLPPIVVPQEWQYPKTVLYADTNHVGTPRNQDGTLPYTSAGNFIVQGSSIKPVK